jgi:uncharacterized protein
MIKRQMAESLAKAAVGFPILAITGPRQSGKTTLAKMSFPDYQYYNLENPETLTKARIDPRSLFKNLEKGIIIDEVQKCPELLSWAQVNVDSQPLNGKLILTGSNQFEYTRDISQSLAGRVAMFKLLPLSLEELAPMGGADWEYSAWKGFYPRLYNARIDPQMYYSSYLMTYLERDVRALMQIRNMQDFERFVYLCAGRTGQLLNVSSISVECGVDHKTIQSWLSLLQASFVIHLLPPWHRNLNKRLIKSPKLYFLDCGLAAHLLGIRKQSDLALHPLRGQIFETMIVSEVLKYYYNRGVSTQVCFFRDANGREIDLILPRSADPLPVEIKSGTTIQPDFFKNINYLRKLVGKDLPAGVIFADDREDEIARTSIYPWFRTADFLSKLDDNPI